MKFQNCYLKTSVLGGEIFYLFEKACFRNAVFLEIDMRITDEAFVLETI